MTQRTEHSMLIARKIATTGCFVAIVATLALACQCGPESGIAPGDACDEEGEHQEGFVCVDGQWVDETTDVGFDIDEEGDVEEDNDVDDEECEPESHEEFCERHDIECGSLEAEDNCGEERTVHCDEFDGYGCDDPKVCVHAEDDGDLDTNVCRCPSLGDSPAQEICNYADAECGTVDAEEVCEDWDGLGEVDCGQCDGDDECGEEIDNVCGCPCEIDGDCYASGETASDNECLICDPEEDDEEFTEAEDGTSCEDDGVCESGECVCENEDAICDDECVDLDSNRDHCGECDNECDDDEVCDGGECVDSCPDEDAMCDGECVDLDSDVDHCGECNNECTTNDPDASASCEDGDCVYECEDEEDTFCGGICTDTDQDRNHCGECDNQCGINEFCNDGSCEGLDGSCEDEDDCGTGQQCCEDQCIPAAAPC